MVSDIYNELDRSKISMTVISVGQEELLSRRTFFLEQKKSQIIGRFMTKEHIQRYSYTRFDEIQLCLKCYDQVSEFPEGSGWSFTRCYFPQAFDDGVRLEKSAIELYYLFKRLRREYRLSNNLEIPMEYFAYTVENAMKQGYSNELYWSTMRLR